MLCDLGATRGGLAILHAGFSPNGVTPSHDGKSKLSRRRAADAFPKSWELSSAALDASRASPTAASASRTCVGKLTSVISISLGSLVRSSIGTDFGGRLIDKANQNAFGWIDKVLAQYLSNFRQSIFVYRKPLTSETSPRSINADRLDSVPCLRLKPEPDQAAE